jgi:hypothetical protein
LVGFINLFFDGKCSFLPSLSIELFVGSQYGHRVIIREREWKIIRGEGGKEAEVKIM